MVLIKKRKKFFLLIAENTRNISLIKAVGRIPYYFHLIYGYNSIILSYKNEKDYPFLEKYTSGLKLEFLKKRRVFNKIFDAELSVIIYLIKNFKKIDVLELYWLTNRSILYGLIYKLLNKNGIVYLKMDATRRIINHNKIHPNGFLNYYYYEKMSLLNYVKNFIRIFIGKRICGFFFKKLDLMSIESKDIYNAIKNYPKIKDKIIYLPNGFDHYLIKKLGIKQIEFNKKKNIILTVGRIGWSPKAHHVLLEAVSKIKNLKDWSVYLIGPIENNFNKYIENFFKKYPNLKDKIIFTGEILDRKKLYEFYQKSKIFCLTSRSESFGNVLVEAGYFGNYIVSSNIPPSRDITKNGQIGSLFEIENSKELSSILKNLINNEKILENNCLKIQKYIDKNFLWSIIISKLYAEINKRKKF